MWKELATLFNSKSTELPQEPKTEISILEGAPKFDLSAGGIPVLTMQYEGRDFTLLTHKATSIAERMVRRYKERGIDAMFGPPFDLWASRDHKRPTLYPFPNSFNQEDNRVEKVVGIFVPADRFLNLFGERHVA